MGRCLFLLPLATLALCLVGGRRGTGVAGRGFCRIQAASWCSFRYSSVQLNEMFCGSLCLSLTRAVVLPPFPAPPLVHFLVAPRSMQQFFMVRIQAKIMFSYSRVRNLLGQWAENKWTATERVAVTVGVVEADVCGLGGGVCGCVCVCLPTIDACQWVFKCGCGRVGAQLITFRQRHC